MVLKILNYIIKWPIIIGATSVISYTSHESIESFLNKVHYYTTSPAPGFIETDHALDLKIKLRKNVKGDLETYLANDEIELPIYAKENGLMVGEPQYNFNNFTNEERRALCMCPSSKRTQSSNPSQNTNSIMNFLHEIYSFIAD